MSELVLSQTLSGRVEGLNVIELQRPDVPDVLLITFRGAKVGSIWQQKRVYATALTVTPTPFLCQAVVVCWEPEAGELAVLDLYSFAHDAIGTGSAVRAHEPEVVRPTGPCLPQ